jgi:hypothetical protein
VLSRTPYRLTRSSLRHGQFRFWPSLQPLAGFDRYGPETRPAALRYFGRSLWEIERILGKQSPDSELRENLAWMLWSYARDVTNKEGSGLARPAKINRYLVPLQKPARKLREALLKLDAAYARKDDAGTTAEIMLGAAHVNVAGLIDQLGGILLITNKMIEKDKGGRAADNAYYLLLARAADAYELATRQQPTLTWNEIKGVYSSNFFKIAELVDRAAAAATGASPKSNGSLGEHLKVLRAHRKSLLPTMGETSGK